MKMLFEVVACVAIVLLVAATCADGVVVWRDDARECTLLQDDAFLECTRP